LQKYHKRMGHAKRLGSKPIKPSAQCPRVAQRRSDRSFLICLLVGAIKAAKEKNACRREAAVGSFAVGKQLPALQAILSVPGFGANMHAGKRLRIKQTRSS